MGHRGRESWGRSSGLTGSKRCPVSNAAPLGIRTQPGQVPSRCLEAQLEPGGVREGNVSIDLSLGDWGGKTEVLQMKWW